jgi:hypothetical protein
MMARTIGLLAVLLFVTACQPKPAATPAAPITDDTMQMLRETFGPDSVGTVVAVEQDLVAVKGLPLDGWKMGEVVTFMDGNRQTVAQGMFDQIRDGFPIIKLDANATAPAAGSAVIRTSTAKSATPSTPPTTETAPATAPSPTTPAAIVTPATPTTPGGPTTTPAVP